MYSIRYIIFIYLCTRVCWSRIHNFDITNDVRKYILLSTFGFYRGGYLKVELTNFRANPENDYAVFGFSLDKIGNDGMNPYLDGQDQCVLEYPSTAILFKLNLKNEKLLLKCNNQRTVHIYKNNENIKTDSSNCNNLNYDISSSLDKDGHKYYNASFIMVVGSAYEEGLYSLFFHSCPNYNFEIETSVNFNIKIVEQNPNSYLSAGDMPLPTLYCMMSLLFLLSGMFWLFLLRKSKYPVFKIHYMMSVLIFLKAISLASQGVNFYYIERLGVHLATWSTLFHVAHLLEEVLLIVVVILIGTGWTFIKRVLTMRDKILVVTVVVLKAAEIMYEVSEEEGARRNYVIFVDLLCCGCILFPAACSMRRLRIASQRGIPALNLKKLQLFRHFYVMLVFYIYFTRIVVYLLRINLPFLYSWLCEMFREMVTYAFFVLTAYKFMPASQNPSFALSDEEGNDVDKARKEMVPQRDGSKLSPK